MFRECGNARGYGVTLLRLDERLGLTALPLPVP